MRVSAMLCAVMVGVGATAAVAQEPLPPERLRLTRHVSEAAVVRRPAGLQRAGAAPSARRRPRADGQSRRAFATPDTLTLPGGTTAGLQTGQQFFVRRLLLGNNHRKPTVDRPRHGAHRRLGHHHRLRQLRGPGPHRPCVRRLHPGRLPRALHAGADARRRWPRRGTPQFDDMGQLMFGNDGRRSFANGDLIILNRGSAHGLTAGARLERVPRHEARRTAGARGPCHRAHGGR